MRSPRPTPERGFEWGPPELREPWEPPEVMPRGVGPFAASCCYGCPGADKPECCAHRAMFPTAAFAAGDGGGLRGRRRRWAFNLWRRRERTA